MLISCPKCNTVYDVADDLLLSVGRKLRCAICENVWLAKQEDALSMLEKEKYDSIIVIESPENVDSDDVIETTENQIAAEESPQNVEDEDNTPSIEEVSEDEVSEPSLESEETQDKTSDANEIMARLTDQNETIFRSEKGSVDIKEKSGLVRALGLHNKSTRTFYFLMFFLILFLSLFYARYEITRTFPFMGKVYASLGIKSTIPGYGLEFKNVTRREFEEDYIHKLEIKGFVANTSAHMVDVPVIRIEMLDKDTNVLQTAETRVPVSRLAPEGRISFTALVIKPSTFTSYVLLTFVDEN